MQNYESVAYDEGDEMMVIHFKEHIRLLDANGQLVLNNLRLMAESYCEGVNYDPRKLLWMLFKSGGGQVADTNTIQVPVEKMTALARLAPGNRFRGQEITADRWSELADRLPIVRYCVSSFSWSIIDLTDWRTARDMALNFVKMCAGAKFDELACEWNF